MPVVHVLSTSSSTLLCQTCVPSSVILPLPGPNSCVANKYSFHVCCAPSFTKVSNYKAKVSVKKTETEMVLLCRCSILLSHLTTSFDLDAVSSCWPLSSSFIALRSMHCQLTDRFASRSSVPPEPSDTKQKGLGRSRSVY